MTRMEFRYISVPWTNPFGTTLQARRTIETQNPIHSTYEFLIPTCITTTESSSTTYRSGGDTMVKSSTTRRSASGTTFESSRSPGLW